MNILLDTHIAIWALNDDPCLPQKARELILDPENSIYYSTVSTWEILLKHSRDRSNLELSAAEFVEYCEEAGYNPLNLYDRHILAVSFLRQKAGAPVHKDPFDQLLLAQAKTEKLRFLTHDRLIPTYEENFIIPV